MLVDVLDVSDCESVRVKERERVRASDMVDVSVEESLRVELVDADGLTLGLAVGGSDLVDDAETLRDVDSE